MVRVILIESRGTYYREVRAPILSGTHLIGWLAANLSETRNLGVLSS
jgi:hypothetical protein